MRTSPAHDPADLPLAGRGPSIQDDLDDAVIVRATNDDAADVTPADAGRADRPLSRAERRGARRARAGRRPPPTYGGASPVPIKRLVKRGRDPRLPRR